MRQIYWLCVTATSSEQFLLGFIVKIMKTLSKCLNTVLQRGLDIFVFRFGVRTHLCAPPQTESRCWLKSFTADQLSVYTKKKNWSLLWHFWRIHDTLRFTQITDVLPSISPINLHEWAISFATGLKPWESAFPPNVSFWNFSTRN